jgi:hypothetical protein
MTRTVRDVMPPPSCRPLHGDAAAVALLPHQEPHVARLIRILGSSPFALDLSSLGSGKTFAAGAVCRRLGLQGVVVVAPVSVQTKWEQMRVVHGLPLLANLSYCGIKGVKGQPRPKHGLLVRHDLVEEDGRGQTVRTVEFEVSDAFRALLRAGVLLVVDEMQHVKNLSVQFCACQAMVRAVVQAWEESAQPLAARRSRVLLLSGSPIDKQDQAVRLLRTLNICRHEELKRYDPVRHAVVWTGMEDVRSYCAEIDSRTTRDLVFWHDADLRHLCYLLFQKVIKPAVSASMVAPRLSHGEMTCFNAFYSVRDPADLHRLQQGLVALESAVFLDADGEVDYAARGRAGGSMATISAIGRALHAIETAKVSTFLRVAREHAAAVATSKVAICLNYTAPLQAIRRALEADGHRVLVLDGGVPMHERTEVLRRFQAPDTTWRFLVGNLGVCSTGIDLDDKHGGFPRFALVSPNYSPMTLFQLGHRFSRADTKSPSVVHMLYAHGAHETRILDALARKGSIMKETTPEQVTHGGVVFPGEYPCFVEP